MLCLGILLAFPREADDEEGPRPVGLGGGRQREAKPSFWKQESVRRRGGAVSCSPEEVSL